MGVSIARPDIYDELVETRRKLRESEADNWALRAERAELESRLNASAARALAWELSRGPNWLEIKMRLDPCVLEYAPSKSEAFNVAVETAALNLWAAYREKFNPVTQPPEAPNGTD